MEQCAGGSMPGMGSFKGHEMTFFSTHIVHYLVCNLDMSLLPKLICIVINLKNVRCGNVWLGKGVFPGNLGRNRHSLVNWW